MKHLTLLVSLTFLAFIAGCTQSSKTTSSSTKETVTSSCIGDTYYCSSSCAGYNTGYDCSSYSGTTSSGTTTGSTTTGGTNGYTTIPKDNNWQALYPSGEPTGSCTAATAVTGKYATRKGTVTMSGGVYYSPDLSWGVDATGSSTYTSIRWSHNISGFLTDVTQARSFIDSDAVLKIRFKPRAQTKAPAGKTYCYGRATGQSSDSYGYTQLRFTVALKGTDNILKGAQELTVGVNSCSSAIDFSNYAAAGDVLVIRDVYSNTGCTYQSGCTSWKKVRDASCWGMDIEVQADDTYTLP